MVISLYFHIPFCTKKCPYCHFFVLSNQDKHRKVFEKALLKEWTLRLPLFKDHEIVSLYFGGGTPSLSPEIIEKILKQADHLKLHSQVEITVEANPEDLNPTLIHKFKKMGVNRLSLGIQSLDNQLLKILGRKHSSQAAIDAVHTIYKEGIENITIDLMNELPYQTMKSWQNTLDQVVRLPITHLSLYNLTFEKNTVFTKNKKILSPHLPSSEDCVLMLKMAYDQLQTMGLKQYEISAFAKEGFEAIHNTGYWIGRSFLGFGPSAFSYWNEKRFQNACHLKRYAKKLYEGYLPVEFEEKLPYPANLHERLAIYLRLNRGVNTERFSLPPTAIPIIKELKREGLLKQTNHHLILTKQGRLFYDTVAEKIIL